MCQTLFVELGFGLGGIGQCRIDLATFERLEQRQGRAGHRLHRDAGVGAECMQQSRRKTRVDQGAVHTQPQRVGQRFALLRQHGSPGKQRCERQRKQVAA